MFQFELGQKVRDKVSGFIGVITCRSEWLYGPVCYTVQPDELDENGKVRDPHSFNEPQLDLAVIRNSAGFKEAV